MRNKNCPICGDRAESVLQLHLNAKMNLPTEIEISHCESDNFLFVANGSTLDYDDYYRSQANDSYHGEVSGGNLRSPIAMLQRSYLVPALDGFLDQPRKVLDFGCGEASLLVELASEFPCSAFFGFDPGPAAQFGSEKASGLGLNNIHISDLEKIKDRGPYDLVVLSHVVEHLLDFDLLDLLYALLTEKGLLYVEVPNSIQYVSHQRLEFLYYFDRLHVNHFTPQSLARVASSHGFGYVRHFEYAFPYRDGDQYPALGVLFRKGEPSIGISSLSSIEAIRRYIALEKERAKELAKNLNGYEGVLVWGAGDNFYRSCENGGPLSALRNMIILDRRPQTISIAGKEYRTEDPHDGIRRYSWPVVITVSEGRESLCNQVKQIDPHRPIFSV